MGKPVLAIFSFALGVLFAELFLAPNSLVHFEANKLAHYIYKNGNFENVSAKDIFSDDESQWNEICHNITQNTETLENIKARSGPFGDDEIFYDLTRLVLKGESETVALFFDNRFFEIESNIECEPINSVFISASKSDKTEIKLRVNK